MIRNDPSKKGQEVPGTSEIFGDFCRYRVAAVYTRFASVEWFVWDAEQVDELDMLAVVRQAPTKELAMRGLEASLTDDF